jgi:hypothetical protein
MHTETRTASNRNTRSTAARLQNAEFLSKKVHGPWSIVPPRPPFKLFMDFMVEKWISGN